MPIWQNRWAANASASKSPARFLEVERADMGLAREWRDATRWAFREAVKAGFVVAEFCRSIRGQQGPGAYLLQQAKVSELIPEVKESR